MAGDDEEDDPCGSGDDDAAEAAAIDIEALAYVVFQRLKEELWIEKDRQGWRRLW